MKERGERPGPDLWLELFLCSVNWIPLSWRIFFFEALGRLFYLLDDRHRRIARRNLALAFPEKGAPEREKIVQMAFRHLGRVAAEFPFIPRLGEEGIRRHVFFEGMENFRRAQEKGRGVIFLTAHFGNWEWMAAAFPLFHSSKKRRSNALTSSVDMTNHQIIVSALLLYTVSKSALQT
jgi:lauroyl/myristoyl acyltransferase